MADWKYWIRGIPLYVMLLPGLIYFILFRYVPMTGIVIAFQEFDPFLGVFESPWVGAAHFERLFTDPDFFRLLANTLILSSMNLFLFFPAPILFALLLHEVRRSLLRRSVQTIVYLPHFLSWVVVASITIILFAPNGGSFNDMLESLGLPRSNMLISPDAFPWVYTLQNIWKETGWSAIIFLAALASVDPSLYEAATMDGASRWRQMLHINLPALLPTIVILFILRIGQIMDIGFEHILLMQNPANLATSDVFDTYIYRVGILSAQFSYSSAIGLFKSVIGLLLIVVANRFSRRIGQEGVF